MVKVEREALTSEMPVLKLWKRARRKVLPAHLR
jgi:hypothetical protein